MKLQSRNLSNGIQGDDVRLLHQDLGLLGFRIPASETRGGVFGPKTEAAVRQFQEKAGIKVTGIVNRATARAINEQVGNLPETARREEGAESTLAALEAEAQTAASSTCTVTGTVTSPDSAAVDGLHVQIVDKHVGPGADAVLTTATTDARGRYQVSVSAPAGKTQPDLQARVLSDPTSVRILGTSKVCYNAGSQETLDIHLPANLADLPSEYETLGRALRAHYQGHLRDLQEDEDRQDITYLANKSGWDARAVAMAALADQFSQRHLNPAARPIIPADFYYALFRAGLPADDTLYLVDAEALQGIWENAVTQGVIPKSQESRIASAVADVQAFGKDHILRSRAIAGTSTLEDMLRVALSDEAQRLRFTDLYIRHRGNFRKLWEEVAKQPAEGGLGPDVAQRLQLYGQFAHLTLNNAPLMGNLRSTVSSSVDLVTRGYYRAEEWRRLLGSNIPLPERVPGSTPDEKRANYAEHLAAQVRLSFPTAVIAAQVKSGELPLPASAAAGSRRADSQKVRDGVVAFLTRQQGTFDIGKQPIEKVLPRDRATIDPDPGVAEQVVEQLKRLQRVYQITPTDQAMSTLLANNLDSASQVVRYEEEEFVRLYKERLGGEEKARLTHAKAQMVHNTVLNLVTSYLLARSVPGVGESSSFLFGLGAPESGGDVLAYPTLENLFGSLDFCACEHCRSVLSPAAYLVDLLQFLDRGDRQWRDFLAAWKAEHGNAPYPFNDAAAWEKFKNDWKKLHPDQEPPSTEITPFDVLMSRRPDLQHLPLTCENTNTPLPYIDLVNETLEYFVTHNASLTGYLGHDTGSVASQDLLANPQFVNETAYNTLKDALFPPPLPFHKPLEALRRYFAKMEVPLAEAMERLRKSDVLDIDRSKEPQPPITDYGWRDILMEELELSRPEHRLLTDGSLTLQQIYGLPAAADARRELANVKAFCRRMRISYEEIVEVVATRFINPNSWLVPLLERLHVPFSTLKQLKDGTISEDDFNRRLPFAQAGPEYDGNVAKWVKKEENYTRIMGLILITNPTNSEDLCLFDALEFRYSNPDGNANSLRAIDFVRLLRFLRLWKKLGLTVDQTDQLISALYPAAELPAGRDETADLQTLGRGFRVLLSRIGVVFRLMDRLKLTHEDLPGLLACWSPIGTQGSDALYRRMFLSPALLRLDAAFARNSSGNFLTDSSQKLRAHAEAVRAACGLTGEELSLIETDLNFNDTTNLTLDNLSAVYRRGWLARKLSLSIRELLLLKQRTGIDPFAAPDPPTPAMESFIGMVEAFRAVSLKPVQALYLLWNEDVSGTSIPEEGQITDLARSLRTGFAAVESELVVSGAPDAQAARSRMAQVYGAEATDVFFGLIEGTLRFAVEYDHSAETLESAILTAAKGRLTYDDLRKSLSYAGDLDPATRDRLKNVSDVSTDFKTAMDLLHTKSDAATSSFFGRYPELRPLYAEYASSSKSPEEAREVLLDKLLCDLKERRKSQQALTIVSAALRTDLAFAQTLLTDEGVLHAVAGTAKPALNDLLALETPDLSGDSTTGVWSGYLEAPTNGFYNLRIETDSPTVSLSLGGSNVPLEETRNVWSNKNPIELTAGVLQRIQIVVAVGKGRPVVRWKTEGRGWEVIPERSLYSADLVDRLRSTTIRFLKASSLAVALKMTALEIVHFATRDEYKIGEKGWLNALAVSGGPDVATSQALRDVLVELLDFARLKVELSPDDERLLSVLQNPDATLANGERLLLRLTGWEEHSLDALLAHFDKDRDDLAGVELFYRVHDAYAVVKKLGIPAPVLLNAVTNEPDGGTVRGLQSALRARHGEPDWLAVIRPINDEMRKLQRDALVAHVLQKLGESVDTRHIETPDKLFEYFLMDVAMEPCMQTSRVRHALSSIQLFIDRCLMNLEARVAPSVINARHWEWMQRYRIWEANRKVFLWPENWLEPELRDDQSPFFKEIMSELLQGDITEDRAATAVVDYLSKLEEVAKLEPCGIHYVENQPGTADDVVHVVARTAGARRKYYYRRREGLSWTPWEQIMLDIEDIPLLPVVWKNRLFLFWLKILKQGVQTVTKPRVGDVPLTEIRTSNITDEPAQVTVQAVLCWSEYYNGKWQAVKTSDAKQPGLVGQYPLASRFDRSTHLTLEATETGEVLRISIKRGSRRPSFLFYNTHSLPILGEASSEWLGRDLEEIGDRIPYRDLQTQSGSFGVLYAHLELEVDPWHFPRPTLVESKWRKVLNSTLLPRFVEPHHPLQNLWDSPYFFEDSRHLFYVSTSERLVSIPEVTQFGLESRSPLRLTEIPPLMLEQPSLTEGTNIRTGLGTSATFRFGGKEIGPAGSLVKSRIQ